LINKKHISLKVTYGAGMDVTHQCKLIHVCTTVKFIYDK